MTDDTFSVGHPFYFPTQVILLDDDPDFLEGVSLMLNKCLSFKTFQSAQKALEYVNSAHKNVQIQERCYSNYKTGPLESDSLTHIDIDKLHLELLNGSRFQTASTVIVDYSMPEMNGLEFLLKLKNPFIKKVLLTGQADMELAIKAFNKQLIDQFIDKHDPKLRLKLNSVIESFQDLYFKSSFKLISDPIIANNRDAFLVDKAFQDFFHDFRTKHNYVEYYMIDTPVPGFLVVDDKGNSGNLLIYTDEALSSHIAMLKELKAPEILITKVAAKELIPGFSFNEEDNDQHQEKLNDWENYYHTPIHISESANYFLTLVPAKQLENLKEKNIISYSEFLEANSITSEILH
jgi:CheY-like chemotaxis protein